MKHDLTTGTWQDDTGCPIIIILVTTSDECRCSVRLPIFVCALVYGQTHVGLTAILAKDPFAFVRALLWQDVIPSNRSTGRVAGALISYAAALRISTLKSLATG